MTVNIQSTELDFNAIRNKLKTYFESKNEFVDYNFEGSALSNLLDVLAWNTHFNALTANMAINESFLETSQLRSSVITHAQDLGYFPKSKTSSQATVKISTNLSSYVGTRPEVITLPSGTKFTSTVDDTGYIFQTQKAYSATDDGFGGYIFVDENESSDLKIHEGSQITKTFFVSERNRQPVYVIPDSSLDYETMVVKVYDDQSSSSYESYTNIKDAIRINEDSKYYLLREAPNGYYELQFGYENSFGKTPVAGNMIVVTYLRCNGESGNGAGIFVPDSELTVNSQDFTIFVETISSSQGGSDIESILNIKRNAPYNYAAQGRMVTKQDYKNLILSSKSSITNVSAWGGEENDPVDYGKIYLSLIYADENIDSDEKSLIQSEITNDLITPLATMSIDPVFVEPESVYLALSCDYDFNPNKTTKTSTTVSSMIKNTIDEYFNNNLKTFDGVFRLSNLVTEIDNLDPSILSADISVKMIKKFTPLLGTEKKYIISFPVGISDVDKDEYVITSEYFILDNETVKIRNKLGDNVLQIIRQDDNAIIKSNIGSYSGTKVVIDSLLIDSLFSNKTQIKIIATPSNQNTIKPSKNYIVDLDDDLTVVKATIDYQERSSV